MFPPQSNLYKQIPKSNAKNWQSAAGKVKTVQQIQAVKKNQVKPEAVKKEEPKPKKKEEQKLTKKEEPKQPKTEEPAEIEKKEDKPTLVQQSPISPQEDIFPKVCYFYLVY